MRAVATNTSWQIGARIVTALIAVVQASVLSHYLHSQGYGRYGFVLAVIGLFAVLTDMGLGLVTVRMLGSDDPGVRSRTMSSVLIAKVCLSALALVVSNLFALLAHLDLMEREGIVLMSALYLVSIPSAASALFQAELELQYPLAISTIQALLNLVLTMLLVAQRAPLLALFGVQLGTALLGSISIYLLAVVRYSLSIHLDTEGGIRMLRQSIPVGVSQVLVVLYFRIDTVLLGVLRGPVSVAHYTAAYRFVDLGSFAATAFMGSVYPLMIRLGEEGARTRLLLLYQRATDVLMFLAVPLCVSWFILARSIIFLVYPGDFSPSVGALRILSLVFIPLFLNNVLGQLVLTLHKEKTFMWVSVGALVLNVGLNLALIPAYGITAAAVITVVSEAFVTVVGSAIMWRALHFLPSLRPTLLIVIATALMGVPMYFLRERWIAASVAGGVVYLGATRSLNVWSWRDLRNVTGLSQSTEM